MKLRMGARVWAGLDIGSYSVKLVALPPGGGRCRFAEAVIPSALASEDEVPAAILAGLIGDCMSRIELSARAFRGIAVGVSGPDVIVKQVSLPLMEEIEVASALRFEARKHLPFDVQTMVLDHQVLGRNFTERRIDVLLAAVSQQRLDRALAPLRELGLEADIVDATPLALANALHHAATRDASSENEPRLLLDLGHQGSWLTLRQASQPFFSRRLEWGGAELSRAIAVSFGGALDRADAWKLDAGASLNQSGLEAIAARHAVDRLAEEVRRSLAFYGTLAQLPERLSLRVCGGTSRLSGLTARLSEALGVPATPFSPLDALDRGVRAPTGGPQYAQAYGLALRAA